MVAAVGPFPAEAEFGTQTREGHSLAGSSLSSPPPPWDGLVAHLAPSIKAFPFPMSWL